jgi:4-amino-4-deoxy-L-arabinose transferase-like glycosyltransferase
MPVKEIDRTTLFFVLLGIIFFIPFLGGVHLFDWDEINFAEIAREMVVLEEYLRIHVNFIPFMEKPPLFFWLQAMSMHLFGIGEFAARFPNAMAGIITLPVLYRMGRRLHHQTFGLFWALTYFGSILPHLYFRSGIIDPFFNLFIFLGIYYLILFYWKKRSIGNMPVGESFTTLLILAGLFTGLAVLTKGPVAILVTGLAYGIYWIWHRFRPVLSLLHLFLYGVMVLLVFFIWYGLETIKNGPEFVVEFSIRQYEIFSRADAGHGGFPGYHFVVLLIGCFPASVFAIQAMTYKSGETKHSSDFKRWMLILFWVVLILFTIVRSKIVHYSSLTYFPLTYLAAITIVQIIEGKQFFRKGLKVFFISLAVIISIPVLILPFIMKDPHLLDPLFQKDAFALENLNAQVHWSGLEILPALILIGACGVFLYYLKKSKPSLGFKMLFLGVGLFVWSTLIFYIARVEAFSQHAAITFCESKMNEDCYVDTYGYKSYAQLFYTKKSKPDNPNYADRRWLLEGDIDKTVYILTKVNRIKAFEEQYPQFTRIGDQNGFYFYKREPGGE